MYGFPKRLRARPERYRFTRYFDAYRFGNPIGWWSVDSVQYDALGRVVMLIDKTARFHLHLTSGTPVHVTMTNRGPALFINQRIYSGAWIAPTGNDPRTIIFVFQPSFDNSQSLNIFWYNNFRFLFYNSTWYGPMGYKVYHKPDYVIAWYGEGYLHLGINPGLFEIITLRYDGSQLQGYVNGSLVATNTVALDTVYGDFSIGSFEAGFLMQSSRYYFSECVVYPHALDTDAITEITHLMFAQYR